jgi:hypothetical protein
VPPARKYGHLCLAAITLPPPVKRIPPVPPGVPYTIEVWKEVGGNIELPLATIYPLPLALAAFEVACREWPTHRVTLRDRARIVRKPEMPQRSSSTAPVGSGSFADQRATARSNESGCGLSASRPYTLSDGADDDLEAVKDRCFGRTRCKCADPRADRRRAASR